MKHISKILFIVFIFTVLPMAFVHADDLKSDKFEIELVGMPDPADPNDKLEKIPLFLMHKTRENSSNVS